MFAGLWGRKKGRATCSFYLLLCPILLLNIFYSAFSCFPLSFFPSPFLLLFLPPPPPPSGTFSSSYLLFSHTPPTSSSFLPSLSNLLVLPLLPLPSNSMACYSSPSFSCLLLLCLPTFLPSLSLPYVPFRPFPPSSFLFLVSTSWTPPFPSSSLFFFLL